MNRKPYRNVLSTAQESLDAGIRQIRSSIPHAGETGSLIEQLFRSELNKVLPEKVAVADGFVVDSEGRVSKQLDIILYDKLNTPRIFSSDGAQMFPVETTYAAGEIKTKLDGVELRKTFENCHSYKSLVRKAYFKTKGIIQKTVLLFGKEHDHWQSIYFCIAAESALTEQTLLERYRTISREMQLNYDERIDSIFTLDGKCILNSIKPLIQNFPQDNSISLLPDGEGQSCAYATKAPWSLFVHLLLTYMVQAPQPMVNMVAYDNGEPF